MTCGGLNCAYYIIVVELTMFQPFFLSCVRTSVINTLILNDNSTEMNIAVKLCSYSVGLQRAVAE